MKRRSSPLLRTVLASTHLIAAVLLYAGQGEIQQIVRVHGTVVDSLSQRPLPSVAVTLMGKEIHHRLTDITGRFTFESVQAGDYRVVVSRDGYFWRDGDTGPRELSLTTGESTAPLAFTLLKASAISGRIIENADEAAAGVSVSVMRLEYRNGRRGLAAFPLLQSPGTYAVTDRRGEYRLWGLPPGTYYLRVTAGEMPIYYPGTADPDQAAPIVVDAGRDAVASTFRLTRPAAYRVRTSLPNGVGTSNTNPLTPVVGIARISVTPRDSARVVDFTQSDGMTIRGTRYQSPPLLPGQYELHVLVPRPRAYARVAFDIEDRDLDIDPIVLSPGYSIQGRIQGTDAASAVTGAMQVTLTSDGLGQINVAAGTAQDGTFTMPDVLEGRYWISIAGMPREAYIQSVRYNGRRSEDAGVAFGKIAEGILEIELATGGRVSGKVIDAEGNAVPKRPVIIFPIRDWTTNPEAVIVAESDKEGAFTFYRLRPGSYRVLAWAEELPALYRDPRLLNELLPLATSVVVAAGVESPIQVRMVPD